MGAYVYAPQSSGRFYHNPILSLMSLLNAPLFYLSEAKWLSEALFNIIAFQQASKGFTIITRTISLKSLYGNAIKPILLNHTYHKGRSYIAFSQ